MWLGGDEGTKTMCFRPTGNDPANPVFTKVEESELVGEFDLPGAVADEDGKLPEVDLEGMDWDAGAGIAGRLELQPIGPDGRLYRRHFMDLDGLTVRDLCFQGDDLLILAGPTLPIDWPVSIYRWKNSRGTMNGAERFVWQENHSLELAFQQHLAHSTRKQDNPEALTLLDDGKVLIICDSPSAPRLSGNVYSPDEAAILNH